MLAMSDTPIAQFIPYFAKASVPVAFLVPTPTGYEKSIMDATAPIRQLLFDAQVHDYEAQEQGPSNKVLIPAHFVNYSDVTDSVASLYRPVTKKGDPRIWFSNLRKYCSPCNLLAIVVINKELYVSLTFLSQKSQQEFNITVLQHRLFRKLLIKNGLSPRSCSVNSVLYIVRVFCVQSRRVTLGLGIHLKMPLESAEIIRKHQTTRGSS